MPLPGFLTSGSAKPGTGPQPAAGVSHRITLDELAKGQCGVVCDLDLAEGDDNRLRALGICPGRRVWLVRPGDPMVVRVMGSRLGLARELARLVTVEVGTPPCALANDFEPGELDQEGQT